MFRWFPIVLIAVLFIVPVLAEAQSPTDPVVTITDADMVGNVTFTSDNTYLLSGLVFVEDGETLTIEPGTVIKARPTTTEGEDTALIVARGGKIIADGTAENPIIFTAEADDVERSGRHPAVVADGVPRAVGRRHHPGPGVHQHRHG